MIVSVRVAVASSPIDEEFSAKNGFEEEEKGECGIKGIYSYELAKSQRRVF